jgi:SAM-dependent methyltransferase
MPTLKEEEKRSKQQNNGLQYPAYVKFLNQAIEPALPLITKSMKGLVYGCGPVPSLSLLLKQQDLNCINYDSIFFPEMPEGPFDFIFAAECFENFFLPARELQTIKNLLKPGGLLIILTEKWNKPELFSRWSYAKDPRHVTFYHAETFRYISKKYKFNLLESSNPKVIMMQKEEVEVEAEICVE